ncbi:voltage-dependent calcium channel subunit alpha-2/delta-3-like [Vanessa cardui]|uniref:voltage-dependent calcium channel subunit alpha-2/delta-3-like n=1 Tax=Vanessa cardui TaxID=171605 RepID=UPI001F1311AF|nr:voltage-dependent calcium channel subunit alpha-2/delta-3-like [Vanessa cardui]
MHKNINLFIILLICYFFVNVTNASIKTNSMDTIKKSLEEHQGHLLVNKSKTKSVPLKIANVTKVNFVRPKLKKKKTEAKIITLEQVRSWAKAISDKLFENEKQFVRRDILLKGFADIKSEVRNGTAIVEKTTNILNELLERRGRAAESIMRKAEELAANKVPPPSDYTFIRSDDIDVLKQEEKQEKDLELPLNCSSLNKVKLTSSVHFDANVSLEYTSVHVALEVFECDPRVLEHVHWTEGLLSTFRENYAQDATLDFQYMCSAKGFLRHYPAALWQNMYKLKTDGEYLYDCRLRPWYVSASGAPIDVLILLDASGSMNSSNLVIAEQFTLALLSALTDDDQVNVLRFNVVVESPIPCFNEKLVPANHVNSAAMMAALKYQKAVNETKMDNVLTYSVHLLNKQRKAKDTPTSCQQAIVMLTDSLYENYTELMHRIDPDGSIRLFVLWLHDRFGVRDSTRQAAGAAACARDGYFAELVTDADVTEQVLSILRVLERPLVAQRARRLRVYSDVYANVEDPRRSEYYWQQKENAEQTFRYGELRRNKDKFLATEKLYGDYIHIRQLDTYGHYYEGEDVNYRLQISVSVPVFDHSTSENITKVLEEYPVNRLLGVAGVDIPIDHLKLILPYYLLGAGGSLSIVDHRGNIVIHENAKVVFDGDILKPGYRTVDFLDVEQPAADHLPRDYPQDWYEFRKELVVDHPSGHRTMETKSIFEGGMRAILEKKDYYWKRVMNHYTVVVALPKYNTRHAVPDAAFTQQLAREAYKILHDTEFSVHPEWLYCQYVDPHFETKNEEIIHFIKRRRDEANFAMRKIKHLFSPITPSLLEKTYQCNEELMARLCKEIIATGPWMEMDTIEGEHSLGSITTFFASESGLTRWAVRRATSAHAEPPAGAAWARGPREAWYRRAAAAPAALVVHAPVAPARARRNSYLPPPPLGERYEWLTAARTVGHASAGVFGVAGYHFHPKHLEDLLNSVTNLRILDDCDEEDEDDCDARCDGKDWSCVLIDEGAWIVSAVRDDDGEEEDEPLREHLANSHPAAMAALLNANIFKLSWVHDYQGVCFPPKNEKIYSGAPSLPSLVRSAWHSVKMLVRATEHVLTFATLLYSSVPVASDTEAEKEKRRRRLRRDYEREKYERLYDRRVLVNRTRFAACDRSRALYDLQRTPKAMEALRRTPHLCKWPLIGAEVPNTNLLLLAIYNGCKHSGKPVNNPFTNEPVPLAAQWRGPLAARLACWRTRAPLPARAPHTRCFPHDFAYEVGYRQCGPWLPDPDSASSIHLSIVLSMAMFINLFYVIVKII